MRYIAIILGFVCVLGLPFLFKKEQVAVKRVDDTVIIVSPHPENVRSEFARGFREWYRKQTGREVHVDLRNVGGTSEIIKYLDSQYTNSFKNYWVNELGRSWSSEVQSGFSNGRLKLDNSPDDDTEAEAARRAFLKSEVSCGLDIFFGGGSYDHIRQMYRGQFTPSGFKEAHPEYFGSYPDGIPTEFAGEPFYDKNGLWYGTVLASFGLIYNRDALERLGIEQEPTMWADLANPKFYGQLALADPTKSGSVNKAYEMILQVEMLNEVKRTPGDQDGAVRRGWLRGMQITQQMAANARYFTDSAGKPNIDIAMGDCAAGISIDFYGRFQGETVEERSGRARFAYVTPLAASTVSVDPIAMFRGAPNGEVAKRFIEYVMSPAGQALWNLKAGTECSVDLPNGGSETVTGPQDFSLRRPPISPLFYRNGINECRSDPAVNPYLEAGDFVYHAEWTTHLFTERSFIIRVAFIELHHELKRAWKALGDNGFPPEAMAYFSDMSAIDYDTTQGRIKDILSRKNKIEEVRLARELSMHFRQQYEETIRLAEAGR